MNSNIDNSIPLGTIYTNKAFANGDRKTMQNIQYDPFMQSAVEKLKTLGEMEAINYLIKMSKEENGFEMIDGVLFKHDDFTIQTFHKKFGEGYVQNMKTLSDLKLDIIPQYIEAIPNEETLFLVSKIPGAKSEMPYPIWQNEGYKKVSKEAKLKAFHDLQKLTKAGLIDDKVAHSNELWFVCPDDNSILLPSWGNLRRIQPNEDRQKILEKYYNILFN